MKLKHYNFNIARRSNIHGRSGIDDVDYYINLCGVDISKPRHISLFRRPFILKFRNKFIDILTE